MILQNFYSSPPPSYNIYDFATNYCYMYIIIYAVQNICIIFFLNSYECRRIDEKLNARSRGKKTFRKDAADDGETILRCGVIHCIYGILLPKIPLNDYYCRQSVFEIFAGFVPDQPPVSYVAPTTTTQALPYHVPVMVTLPLPTSCTVQRLPRPVRHLQ